MIDRHTLAAEQLIRVHTLRKVIKHLGALTDRITVDHVNRTSGFYIGVLRTAKRIRRREALILATELEHAAIAELIETLEKVIEQQLREATSNLAMVARDAKTWKADKRNEDTNGRPS